MDESLHASLSPLPGILRPVLSTYGRKIEFRGAKRPGLPVIASRYEAKENQENREAVFVALF